MPSAVFTQEPPYIRASYTTHHKHHPDLTTITTACNFIAVGLHLITRSRTQPVTCQVQPLVRYLMFWNCSEQILTFAAWRSASGLYRSHVTAHLTSSTLKQPALLFTGAQMLCCIAIWIWPLGLLIINFPPPPPPSDLTQGLR